MSQVWHILEQRFLKRNKLEKLVQKHNLFSGNSFSQYGIIIRRSEKGKISIEILGEKIRSNNKVQELDNEETYIIREVD